MAYFFKRVNKHVADILVRGQPGNKQSRVCIYTTLTPFNDEFLTPSLLPHNKSQIGVAEGFPRPAALFLLWDTEAIMTRCSFIQVNELTTNKVW